MKFQVLSYVRELNPSFVEHYDARYFLVKDNWNDYDFYTLFNLYSWINRKLQYIGMVKIGRFGFAKGKVEIPDSFDELSKEYFSLGQSIEYYEYFANIEDGKDALSALQDYVVESNQTRLRNINEEEVFIRSLRRWDENKEQTIIEYKQILDVGVKTKDYSFIYTNKKGLDLEFTVEKDSFPQTNLHALTGRNGVGKSRLLLEMVKTLIGKSNELLFENNYGIQSFSKVIHINLSPFSFNNMENYSILPYHYLGGEWSKIKHQEKSINENNPIFINKAINELYIEKFKDYLMLIGKAKKFDLWTNFFDRLESDPVLKSINLSERILKEELFNHSNTDIVLQKIFSELSDGHKALLLTVSCLIAHVSERTIVFIDEPEAHLHPPLVSTLIRSIIDVLKTQNGVGIIVTHSPIVLQEIPKECIWILNRFGKVLVAKRPILETFAENINSIIAEQFGLQLQNSGFYYYIKEAVKLCDSEDKALNLFKHRLGWEGQILIKMLFSNKGK